MVHPRTGASITYVAAALTREAEGQIRLAADGSGGRDDRELTEVRWFSLAGAEDLMGDISGAVRQHLRQVLKMSL
jgi:hypothetical protein